MSWNDEPTPASSKEVKSAKPRDSVEAGTPEYRPTVAGPKTDHDDASIHPRRLVSGCNIDYMDYDIEV
jgi:hypothetical protein